MNSEDVRKVCDELQIGVEEAKRIVRRREKITRLQNLRDSALRRNELTALQLVELLLEETMREELGK